MVLCDVASLIRLSITIRGLANFTLSRKHALTKVIETRTEVALAGGL